MDGLKASCECIDDLMINLFKFYQVASDRELVRYIKTKQYQYDYGYNISTDRWMTFNFNKFEILWKYNKWNSMSPEQEQIIALASFVEKLKDNNLKLSKIFKTLTPRKGKIKIKGKVRN